MRTAHSATAERLPHGGQRRGFPAWHPKERTPRKGSLSNRIPSTRGRERPPHRDARSSQHPPDAFFDQALGPLVRNRSECTMRAWTGRTPTSAPHGSVRDGLCGLCPPPLRARHARHAARSRKGCAPAMKGPRGAKGRLPRPRAPLAEVALFPLGVASSLAYYSARCVLPKAKEGEMRVNSLALRTEIALWIRHCGTKLCGTKKKRSFWSTQHFHIE